MNSLICAFVVRIWRKTHFSMARLICTPTRACATCTLTPYLSFNAVLTPKYLHQHTASQFLGNFLSVKCRSWGHIHHRRAVDITYNIGIKHDFLCINICWALREVLKPEPERWGVETQGVETKAWKARCWNPRCWNPSLKGEGFNTSRGAQQMLMYQKSMFDRYYCIQTFCRSKTLEKLLQIYFFPVPITVW